MSMNRNEERTESHRRCPGAGQLSSCSHGDAEAAAQRSRGLVKARPRPRRRVTVTGVTLDNEGRAVTKRRGSTLVLSGCRDG